MKNIAINTLQLLYPHLISSNCTAQTDDFYSDHFLSVITQIE